MTVIKSFTYDATNFARIGHGLNWTVGGTVSASGTATGYFEDAPDNSLTYEKWKPDTVESDWQNLFVGTRAVDYCGIAGHTLGTNRVEVTAQYQGNLRTNYVTTSETGQLFSTSTFAFVMANTELDAAGRAVLNTMFMSEDATFARVLPQVDTMTIQRNYGVLSLEVCQPVTGVLASQVSNSIWFRVEGTALGAGGTETNSTYRFDFDTETLTKQAGATASAFGFERLSDSHYRLFLAVEGTEIDDIAVYATWGVAEQKTICFGNVQLEDNATPAPTSYVPSVPAFTSRGTKARYTDANGIIQFADVNELRRTHAYRNGDWRNGGVMLETFAANDCLWSEQFQNAAWTKFGSTFTADAALAPNGNTVADLMEDNADFTTQAVLVEQSFSILPRSKNFISIYVKRYKSNAIRLGSFGYSSNTWFAFFDVLNGDVLEVSTDCAAFIEPVGDGWFRCLIMFKPGLTDSVGGLRVSLADNSTGTPTTTILRDGNNGVYLWGGMVSRESPKPSSYIKTESTAVTRDTDVVVENSTSSDWHDLTPPAVPADDSPIMAISDAVQTAGCRVRLRGNTAPEIAVIKFGQALRFPEKTYAGHKPVDFAREIVYQNNKSVTGEFLGRRKKSTMLASSISWEHLRYDWINENWRDFQIASESDPIFIAWRPNEYRHVGYVETSATAVPESMGVQDFYTVTISGTGLGYE